GWRRAIGSACPTRRLASRRQAWSSQAPYFEPCAHERGFCIGSKSQEATEAAQEAHSRGRREACGLGSQGVAIQVESRISPRQEGKAQEGEDRGGLTRFAARGADAHT